MKVSIKDARDKLSCLLKISGASQSNIKTLVEMQLEYDFHKNTFSGFSEIEGLIDELRQSRDRKFKIVVNKPAMKLIDGQGLSARLIGIKAVKIVSKMAKKTGVGILGIFNSTYHGILETYSRKIAENDLIAIILANGGPAGVTPFNGCFPIFGTNPISYAIPSNNLPIVFDGATAECPFGSIRLARENNKKLPKGAYFDKKGNHTTNPYQAASIIPFGKHKGYAINLLIEILTGAFVRAKMGLQTTNKSDLGSLFIAINPDFFIHIKDFKKQVSQIIKEVKGIKPVKGIKAVYVPGHQGEEAKIKMLKTGFMEIDDTIWTKFEQIYKKYIY